MRRLLKDIAVNQEIGDITSLANPHIVTFLKEKWNLEQKCITV